MGIFVRQQPEYIILPLFFLIGLLVWQLAIVSVELPPYLLPAPLSVWRKFLAVCWDGSLWWHSSYTMLESMIGFASSIAFASVIGYALAKAPLLERLLSPYLVAAQTVPLIAIAPLLIVWLGFGIASKVFIAFIIVFFPMLVNTIIGIRLVNADQRELMRSYSASTWQVFNLLELPSAMPMLLGGIKIGITLAITGALVGEYVGSQRGLGFMILHAKERFDTAQVFVSIFVLVFINVALYAAASILETRVLSGRRRE